MPFQGDKPITLDRWDTLHSAQAKLDSASGSRSFIVLAADCRLARNVLTYKLLARASERFGSPIDLVTGNPHWRQMAREQGLRAYGSVGSLRRARRRSILSLPEGLADSLVCGLHISLVGLVAMAVLLLGGGATAYLYVPVLRVTVSTPVEVLDREIIVRVDVGAEATDLPSSTIPGRIIERRLSVSDSIETTGRKMVGKERARGEVTLISSSPDPITLPAGTMLATGAGERFRTGKAATVGLYSEIAGARVAAPRPEGPTPSPSPVPPVASEVQVRVPVVAVDPGEKGNVPALAISKIEGGAFAGLTVFNERPLAGGTDAGARIVSADDRTRLRESLIERLRLQAVEEMMPRARQSESLIPHSVQVRVEGEEYDGAVDEEADRLKATVYGLATDIAFANQDFNSLVDREWRRSAPSGYLALAGDVKMSPPEVFDAGPRTARLRVKVSGQAERVLEVDELAESLRGRSVEEVEARLARLGLLLRLESLEMWPDWAPSAQRIEVKLVQGELRPRTGEIVGSSRLLAIPPIPPRAR